MSKIFAFAERPYDQAQLHLALEAAGYLVETVYANGRVQLADAETKDPLPVILANIPPPQPVLTPEQLLLSQLEKEVNESHVLVLRALNNWGSLTLAQKDQLLKFLAKFYIVAGVRLGLFQM